VVKLHEEFFLPGEVVLEQGTVVDQIYIVARGCLVLLIFNSNL
jgi:potassium channel